METLTTADKVFLSTTWYNDSTDKHLLKQGMVYLTNEAALANAKALVALTAKE